MASIKYFAYGSNMFEARLQHGTKNMSQSVQRKLRCLMTTPKESRMLPRIQIQTMGGNKANSHYRQRSIVLISCVSQKLTYRTKAQALYTSTLFKLNLQYARILQPDNIFILSAKYGLLPLDRTIKPYEQTLNTMRSAEIKTWAGRVLVQLKNVCCLDETECIFLAGEKYRKHLLPHLRNSKIPLEGLRIGEQLQKLKALCNEQ